MSAGASEALDEEDALQLLQGKVIHIPLKNMQSVILSLLTSYH